MMFLSKASLAYGTRVPGHTRLPDLSEYGIHQEIWRMFPDTPAGARPFLFRKEEGSGRPYFLILSATVPRAMETSWTIESKELNPVIQKGDRLRFVLRANPIISRHEADGKSRRHDVIMHAKFLERQKGGKISNQAAMERRIALDWFKSKADQHGFSFQDPEVKVYGYRRMLVQKPTARAAIKLSIIEFEGILEVTEPKAFLLSLQGGIGPGKGFGCGLMLIRRARN